MTLNRLFIQPNGRDMQVQQLASAHKVEQQKQRQEAASNETKIY